MRRVVRALEVCLVTGRPISEQQGKVPPPYRILIVGLALARVRQEVEKQAAFPFENYYKLMLLHDKKYFFELMAGSMDEMLLPKSWSVGDQDLRSRRVRSSRSSSKAGSLALIKKVRSCSSGTHSATTGSSPSSPRVANSWG